MISCVSPDTPVLISPNELGGLREFVRKHCSLFLTQFKCCSFPLSTHALALKNTRPSYFFLPSLVRSSPIGFSGHPNAKAPSNQNIKKRVNALRYAPPLHIASHLVASVRPHRSALALPLRSVLVTPPIRRATARPRFQFDLVRHPLRSCLFS